MEEERSFTARALSIVGFGLLAFAIAILAGGIWTPLLAGRPSDETFMLAKA